MTVDESLVVERVAARDTAVRAGSGTVTALFSVTAFTGAGLLFVVQPLVARLLLPSYGGSATVWSTSSLFFQVLLLLAYWYVHASTRRLGARWQPRVHLPVLVLPVLVLPLALPGDIAPPEDGSPVLWLLRTLLLVIGLPFAVVATTGPVLQTWYSWTDSRRSEDPYFLFAASNLGSFGGLLAYPLLIEPHLTLAQQRSWWSAGFVVFAVLTAGCAAVAMVRRTSPVQPHRLATVMEGIGRKDLLVWTGLAFLPSSLMLGVTAHISTDVAAIPLMWVVPLAIYLATFVLAFSRTSRTPPVRATRAAVALGFVTVVASLAHGAIPIAVTIGINLLALALVGYAAHARLSASRPHTDDLTRFYLVVSIGGALGGVLNGLLAPMLFDRVLEYPLALVAVPLLLLGVGISSTGWLVEQFRRNRVRASIVIVAVAVAALALRVLLWMSGQSTLAVAALMVLVLAIGWWVSQQPLALILGLVVLYGATGLEESRGTLEQTRTFFGSYTVEARDGTHRLVHGTTMHGTQYVDARLRAEPTTYYARSGPLGDVFGSLDGGRWDRVGAVGLGTGTVAAYGRPGQSMTFFEIDPEMVELARDPGLFTYLSDSEADIETVVGDGRLRVAEYPSGSFDLLLLDAFSSDSIPVHLLTTEAFAMYADRLSPDGMLAVHISNRVFDLAPVLASAADELGWHAVRGTSNDTRNGATPTEWVVLSRDSVDVDALLGMDGWERLGGERVQWTDDYSSILSVLE